MQVAPAWRQIMQAGLIAGLAKKVMDDYAITDKTPLLMTDGASVMKNIVTALNRTLIQEEKSPII